MPSGRKPVVGQPAGGHRHRGGEVQHVDRATAPDLAVDELAAERVVLPALGADRARRRCGPSAAATAPRGRDPRCGRRGWSGRARARSAARSSPGPSSTWVSTSALRTSWPDSTLAVVHALVADERLQQLGDLAGQLVGHGTTDPRRPLRGIASRWMVYWTNMTDSEGSGGGHVVVDGSNIATEGRSQPSLEQLDEAVRSFLEEHPHDTLTVVVDATFAHRIDPSERDEYELAVAANELLTPPAGAIGRGDAFVLQIADRAGATVLSNDSFQEFHGDYTWLFDEGRLIGGKPVPGVGWVFVARSPVRGPASRRSVRDAKERETARSPGAAPAPRPSATARSASQAPPPAGPARRPEPAEPRSTTTAPRVPRPSSKAFQRFAAAHPVGLARPGHGRGLRLPRRLRDRRRRPQLHPARRHGRPRPERRPPGPRPGRDPGVHGRRPSTGSGRASTWPSPASSPTRPRPPRTARRPRWSPTRVAAEAPPPVRRAAARDE